MLHQGFGMSKWLLRSALNNDLSVILIIFVLFPCPPPTLEQHFLCRSSQPWSFPCCMTAEASSQHLFLLF